MDKLWREVLVEHRLALMEKADENDVLLNRLLDHLLAKRCLQSDHKQLIKGQALSRNRCGMLLDYIQFEGASAFDELCHALEAFGTDDKEQLACSLKQALIAKQEIMGRHYTGNIVIVI